MLGDHDVMTTIAVKDLEKAKKFYSETLGLMAGEESMGGITYKSGSGQIFVYESEFAGSNRATYASWHVDDVQAAVDELKAKGISFEQYDLPGASREGDIHSWGDYQAAWFKDPDGNILSIGG